MDFNMIAKQLTLSAVPCEKGASYAVQNGGMIHCYGFKLNNQWAINMLAELLRNHLVGSFSRNQHYKVGMLADMVWSFRLGEFSVNYRVSSNYIVNN